MNPEKWEQVKELLGSALERAPADRSAFLRDACGSDEALDRFSWSFRGLEDSSLGPISVDGNLASALLQKIEQQQPEYSMDSNYVFLCGIMWCNYGSQEAGKELLRATDSSDRDTKALAWAMLAKGMTQLRKRASD